MEQLLDPDDEFTQQVQETVVANSRQREYVDAPQVDEDGVVDILGYELDSEMLEQILMNVKGLPYFTYDGRDLE